MTKEYIWINWSNIDYSKHPTRDSYKKMQGMFDYPVDRFGISGGVLDIPCVNLIKEPKYNLSNLTQDFEERYYAIFDQVADNVYDTAKRNNQTIALLYSGGVDSVCVLVALMRHPSYKEFLGSGRIVLSMTSHSIDEYPEAFYQHILPSIPITVLNYTKLMCDPNVMLVTGDLGDHVISSSDIVGLVDKNFDCSLGWAHLIPHLAAKAGSKEYIELLWASIEHAPFDIVSTSQFVWWANQCYAFQDEFVKPWYWSTTQDFSEIATQNKIFRFFYDDLFIAFSYEYMSTNPKHKNFHECKTWARRYIHNHFKHDSYLTKQKIFSQRLTMRMVEKSQIYIENGVIGGANLDEFV